MKTISTSIKGFNSTFKIAGDKSISHRALMLAGIATGTTKVTGLLESEDVLCTAKAMQQMGAVIHKTSIGDWEITGVESLSASNDPLDMGNAGTGARLLMGLVSTLPFETKFTGDKSLCSRPMNRVILPLSNSGAVFECSENQTLPLTVVGAKQPVGYTYLQQVASAQVKSAILLSGLNVNGETTVIEPNHLQSRDHTERMLKGFGANIEIKEFETERHITVKGKAKLKACDINVPADISSAAFFIVAALITPESDVLLKNIGINPLRAGIIKVLKDMGGDISFESEYEIAGEPVADIRVRSSVLKGIDVPSEIAASMIDEYPILAVAAAFAVGKTTLNGLEELKVKESNRYDAILEGLKKNNIQCEPQVNEKSKESSIVIYGKGKNACGGGLIQAKLDHRIAMSFLVMGLASEEPVFVDDVSSIQTSFPDFITLMNKAGANIYDYSD